MASDVPRVYNLVSCPGAAVQCVFCGDETSLLYTSDPSQLFEVRRSRNKIRSGPLVSHPRLLPIPRKQTHYSCFPAYAPSSLHFTCKRREASVWPAVAAPHVGKLLFWFNHLLTSARLEKRPAPCHYVWRDSEPSEGFKQNSTEEALSPWLSK